MKLKSVGPLNDSDLRTEYLPLLICEPIDPFLLQLDVMILLKILTFFYFSCTFEVDVVTVQSASGS